MEKMEWDKHKVSPWVQIARIVEAVELAEIKEIFTRRMITPTQ